jgi:hypothetical protein
MNRLGALDDGFIVARDILLDTLEVLAVYDRHAIVVVGAQAIYLRCEENPVPRAPFTLDSDIVVDPRRLAPEPPIKVRLFEHGYRLRDGQPGLFVAPNLPAHVSDGANVDIIVPEFFATGRGRRDARLPGDNAMAARRTRGLEAALFDYDFMTIRSLAKPERCVEAAVAGKAALLVSKAFKLGERMDGEAGRMKGKDAADVFRLLRSAAPGTLKARLAELRTEEPLAPLIDESLSYIERLFAGNGAPGLKLLESYLDDSPEAPQISASTRALAEELL